MQVPWAKRLIGCSISFEKKWTEPFFFKIENLVQNIFLSSFLFVGKNKTYGDKRAIPERVKKNGTKLNIKFYSALSHAFSIYSTTTTPPPPTISRTHFSYCIFHRWNTIKPSFDRHCNLACTAACRGLFKYFFLQHQVQLFVVRTNHLRYCTKERNRCRRNLLKERQT